MESGSAKVGSEWQVRYDIPNECEYESKMFCDDMRMIGFVPPMTLDITSLMLYDAFLDSNDTIIGPLKLQSNIDVSKFFLAIHVFYPSCH